MNNNFKPERYFLLFLPWIISILLISTPVLSYFAAWLGSFFIFYISIGGFVKPLPDDLKFGEQLMRPLFLPQVIFAGYMCCTSIFYFMDILGYTDFRSPAGNYFVDLNLLEITVSCQRYYCLGHAALVMGILMAMKYPEKRKFIMNIKDTATFMMLAAIVALPLASIFLLIPGLRQFYFQFNALSFIAGTLALAFAIPLKKPLNTLVCTILYLVNFSQSLLSGFKEPIIISVLVLGIFLYPFYRKTVLAVFVPAIFLLFALLPTYNRIFRERAWTNEENTEDASQAAFEAVFNQTEEDNSNWGFLTHRLSEISMFTKYVSSTPSRVPYYDFTLLQQAITVVIPRALWPGKPITEDMVMERVYEAGVVSRGTPVSAKPPLVSDGYLSGGGVGIFLTLFLYGIAMQLISIKAEYLFGGYTIGTALIFSGLFQILWRGNSFEFITNSVFWSYVSMLVIFRALKYFKIVREA